MPTLETAELGTSNFQLLSDTFRRVIALRRLQTTQCVRLCPVPDALVPDVPRPLGAVSAARPEKWCHCAVGVPSVVIYVTVSPIA